MLNKEHDRMTSIDMNSSSEIFCNVAENYSEAGIIGLHLALLYIPTYLCYCLCCVTVLFLFVIIVPNHSVQVNKCFLSFFYMPLVDSAYTEDTVVGKVKGFVKQFIIYDVKNKLCTCKDTIIVLHFAYLFNISK
jgi:hypothetical protein